jgi:hypothetical protein
VYLYNPAIKLGVSGMFRRPWVGPWRITEKRSRLNNVITDQRGKQLVVRVNRLKEPMIQCIGRGQNRKSYQGMYARNVVN